MWSKGKGKVPIVCLCAHAVDFEEPHCFIQGKWKKEHYSGPLQSGSSRIPTHLRKELSCSSPQKEKVPLQYPQCSVYGHHAVMGCLDEKPGDMGKADTILLPIKSHNLEIESTQPNLPSGSKVTLLANGAVVGAVANGDRIENPILRSQVQDKEKLLTMCTRYGHEFCRASLQKWYPPAHWYTLHNGKRCTCWTQSGSYCRPLDQAST